METKTEYLTDAQFKFDFAGIDALDTTSSVPLEALPIVAMAVMDEDGDIEEFHPDDTPVSITEYQAALARFRRVPVYAANPEPTPTPILRIMGNNAQETQIMQKDSLSPTSLPTRQERASAWYGRLTTLRAECAEISEIVGLWNPVNLFRRELDKMIELLEKNK